MTPPRWPLLVEIDGLTQLSLFYASDKSTTMPVGMRVVCKNLERDTYFVAPWGLHLLYRWRMKRYQRAQAVLQRLREAANPYGQKGPVPTGNVSGSPWTSGTITFTPGPQTYQPGATISTTPCKCPACQSTAPSTTLTP